MKDLTDFEKKSIVGGDTIFSDWGKMLNGFIKGLFGDAPACKCDSEV